MQEQYNQFASIRRYLRRMRHSRHPGLKYLVTLHEGTDATPLFCMHGIDGDCSEYLEIASQLDPRIPVYGLQLGRNANPLEHHPSIDARIEAFERELRVVQPRGPYRLCGYSYGGSEAFSVGNRLQQAGEEVTLILLDSYDDCLRGRLAVRRAKMAKRVREGTVLRTALQMVIRGVKNWLRPAPLPVPMLNRDIVLKQSRQRKLLRFPGRVVLIKCTENDPIFPWRLKLDGRNGWARWCSGPFEMVEVPFGHLALIGGEGARVVAKTITPLLV